MRVFFVRLDEELNKVNQFYIKQEKELNERGETLNKQLQILLELKQIINDRRHKNYRPTKTKTNHSDTFPRSPPTDSHFSGHFSIYPINTFFYIFFLLT